MCDRRHRGRSRATVGTGLGGGYVGVGDWGDGLEVARWEVGAEGQGGEWKLGLFGFCWLHLNGYRGTFAIPGLLNIKIRLRCFTSFCCCELGSISTAQGVATAARSCLRIAKRPTIYGQSFGCLPSIEGLHISHRSSLLPSC